MIIINRDLRLMMKNTLNHQIDHSFFYQIQITIYQLIF